MKREDVEQVFNRYVDRANHLSIMIEQTWEKINDAIFEKNYDKFKTESKKIEEYEDKKALIKEIISDLENLINRDIEESFNSKCKEK
jgi:hypothetical protein